MLFTFDLRLVAVLLFIQAVLLEFFSQGAAIDAQDLGGAALVAASVIQYSFKQGPFDFTEQQLIKL